VIQCEVHGKGKHRFASVVLPYSTVRDIVQVEQGASLDAAYVDRLADFLRGGHVPSAWHLSITRANHIQEADGRVTLPLDPRTPYLLADGKHRHRAMEQLWGDPETRDQVANYLIPLIVHLHHDPDSLRRAFERPTDPIRPTPC
jgi:hypothetical protein